MMKRRRRLKSHGIYGFLHAYGKRPNRTTIMEMSDGEIFAVEMLTVQWAFLEHVLLLETSRLSNRAKLKALPPDAASLSFSRRLAAWRILVRDTVKTKKRRAQLLRMASRIATLEDKRHKITHGLWEWFPHNPDRLRAYSYRPVVSFDEPNLNFQKIMDTAERVSEISYELSHANPIPSSERLGRIQLHHLKAHGYAYWSRRGLLTMMKRDHACLVPSSAMPQSRSPRLRAFLASLPRAECQARDYARRSRRPVARKL
jgi:hypothetical protein